MIVNSVELFFQEGSSDKVYNAYLIQETDGTFSVNVEWGRRNAGFNTGKKAVHVSQGEAQKVYDRLVREKTNKGYQEITKTVQPAAVAPPVGQGSASLGPAAKKVVGERAQLLTAIEDDDVQRLLADDDVIAQQKIDGIRVIATIIGDEIRATNRNGELTDKVTASLLAGLASLPDGTIVDGEVLDDAYWVFDVLQMGAQDIKHVGYEDRWLILADELSPGFSGAIEVLPIVRGAKAKRALFQRLIDNDAEGIVFKKRAAPYTAGRGSTQLKYKLVKSADVVLLKNDGNAYLMGVHHAGKIVEVGKVFAGTTNASRADIDTRLANGEKPVAEVRYLYATDDEQLFQPVFVRLRDDKPASTCVRAQLKKTNKAVLR